jgi:hypothetical protein
MQVAVSCVVKTLKFRRQTAPLPGFMVSSGEKAVTKTKVTTPVRGVEAFAPESAIPRPTRSMKTPPDGSIGWGAIRLPSKTIRPEIPEIRTEFVSETGMETVACPTEMVTGRTSKESFAA